MTFEEFAATRLPALLKFAAVLAGDRATAEDLSQEVLARVYTGWDRIAELLGCAPATVRAHASRGLAALRVELRPQQPSVPGPAGEDSR